MSQIAIPEKDPILTEVLSAYDFPATLLGPGNGADDPCPA